MGSSAMRILCIALALSVPSMLGAEVIGTLILKGPEGATQEQLKEAGKGLAERFRIAGIYRIQWIVRDSAIELKVPGGFYDQLRYSVAAIAYFPAKTVELRVLKTKNDQYSPFVESPKKPPCTLTAIRSFEHPPDSVWMPYLTLRSSIRYPFEVAAKDKLAPLLSFLQPAVPLSVPTPFVLGGTNISRWAFYELTEKRQQAFGNLELVPHETCFGLCVDGYILSWFRLFGDDSDREWRGREGNVLKFNTKYLYTHPCKGYDKHVEAICSVRLPFALNVINSDAPSPPAIRDSRVLGPDDPLAKAYRPTSHSVEAADRFIREHPNERDLCAGALLNKAALLSQMDKKKAIEVYKKAIREYGREIVPDKNANFSVDNWALFRIAKLERNIGNRAIAQQIFRMLMTSASDSNTRNSSRIEYLSTKQSHLKVSATVNVKDMKTFSLGQSIPVTITVQNQSNEGLIFKCYGQIEYQTYRLLTQSEEGEEIELAPNGKRDVPMVFKGKFTKGLVPGIYKVKALLMGIPFDTTTQDIVLRK